MTRSGPTDWEKHPSSVRALRRLRLIVYLGLALAFLYGLRFLPDGVAVLVTVSVTASLALACLAIGALVGFLFGLPRAPVVHPNDAAGGAPIGAGYHDNTNLELASDWVTKLLLGAGLAQIGSLPGFVNSLVQALGPAFGGGAAANTFAVTEVVSFSILGFIYGYLWTRINMATALVEGRLATQFERRMERDDAATALLEQQLDSSRDAVPMSELVQALSGARASIRSRALRRASDRRRDERDAARYALSEKKPADARRRLEHMDRTIPVFRALLATEAPFASDSDRMHVHAQLGYVLKDGYEPDQARLTEAANELSLAIREREQFGFRADARFDLNLAQCKVRLDGDHVDVVLALCENVAIAEDNLLDDGSIIRWLDKNAADPRVLAFLGRHPDFPRRLQRGR